MLALPYKTLEQSAGLFRLGFGTVSVSGIEREQLTLKDRLLVWLFWGASKIVLRYCALLAKDKIEDMHQLTTKLRLIDVALLSPSDYRVLRIWRDKIAVQLVELEDNSSDSRFTPLFFLETMDQLKGAYKNQLNILDESFSKLNTAHDKVIGFTSITEQELWNNRSKAYDYLT